MDISDLIYLCYQVVNEYLNDVELNTITDPWLELIIINFLHKNIELKYITFLRSFSQEFDKLLYKKIGSDIKQYKIKKETQIKCAQLVRIVYNAMKLFNLDTKVILTCV
jgi:hypothetical protein